MLAIAIEVAATSCLKLAGQGNLSAIAGVTVGYVASFSLVAWVVQKLEVGIVYAIWSGAGTAAVALIGVVLLDESAGPAKLMGLALVISGVVVLNVAGTST